MASHYFDWAEELVGIDAVHEVEPFLKSDDGIVRYEAARWLSFRRMSDSVTTVLVNTKNDPDVESWARSGAAQRLEDVHRGYMVPAN